MRITLRILFPLICLVSIVLSPASVTQAQANRSIYVSPNGDDANPGTIDAPLQSIHKALSLALPGSNILLLPGTYTETVRITTGGSPENPVTIQSASASSDKFAILDGETAPKGGGGACITIDAGASWVAIEDMRFRNCWEDVILLEDASYITVRGVQVEGGRHLVQSENRNNHHILIEESYWEQEERIWTEWGRTRAGWEDLHHGAKYFYNGGIYGGYAAGGLVIRNNVIRHAFNGMQWWNKETYDNANAEIYGNFFENILDNGVEPEVGAFNLHIYHNTFHNIPLGVLSVDVVHGGDIYFYGNIGWLDDEPLNAWTIYKLGDSTGPLHIYHNSFYYERALGDKGAEPQSWLRHYNNAYYHIEKDMGPKVDWGAHDHAYDYDCSSAPWSAVIQSRGQELHGLENTDPSFVDPLAGDLRLSADSPCIDRGRIIPNFTQGFDGAAPDIGAYEGDELVAGPPFETLAPPSGLGFEEKPRITRHRVDGSTLHLFFSWPIAPLSVSPGSVRLYVDGRLASVESMSTGTQDTELIIRTSEPLGGKDLRLGFDPLPVGANGEPATFWASTIQPYEVSLPTQSFLDVPPEHPFFAEIEALYQAGYVAGCSADPLMYCPEATMTRAESAVFVERGIHGAGYLPPDPTAGIFADVPLSEWFAKWANGLWEDGYTAGCGTDPLIFCPSRGHTRAEAAVFFERLIHGKGFVPPDPVTQVFDDIPIGAGAPWFSKWVMAAYQDGLVQKCEDDANRGDAFYRPNDGITRAEAACMMDVARGMPRPVRIEFFPSDEDFANPERGFMRQVTVWADGTDSFWGITHPRDPADSLVWIYFRLDNYRSRPLDQAALARIDAAFEAARSAGIKVVPRFIYSTGSWTPDPNEMVPDAPLAQVLDHISQLKPVLVENGDVIAVLQAGFVGHWGEWHSSKNDLTSPENQKAILDALLSALPTERMLQVRYPRDKEAHFGGPLTEANAYSGQPAARIGHHNDCFLASKDDKGTYRSIPVSNPTEETIAYWKDFISQEGAYTPVGGETCQINPPRTSCPTALQELERLHWSFLNNGYNQDVLDSWVTEGCMDTIRRRLGYRLSLTEALIPQAAPPGGVFAFQFGVRNEGFAAMYNEHPIYVVLDGEGASYGAQLQVDPRRWEPGTVHTIQTHLRLPASLSEGVYRLSLWLPDSSDSLRNLPNYAVRFANDQVWDANHGWNTLTRNFEISKDAPTLSDPAALDFVKLTH